MQALTQVYSNAKLKQELDAWAAEGEPAEPAEPKIPAPKLRAAERRPKQLSERRASRPPPAPKAIPPRSESVEASLPATTAVSEGIRPVKSRSYAHGSSMKATLEAVCMRPDLSSKAKFIALVLASHYPTIRPSRERLMVLTGLSLKGVARGLDELRRSLLLEWKRGRAHQANLYTCLWLEH